MNNTHAKIIKGLITKENRVKAVEISGFIKMLQMENKCSEDLVKDVEQYIEILAILYQKFDRLSLNEIQKKQNPIEQKDFAKFVKFHIEITTLMNAAKET